MGTVNPDSDKWIVVDKNSNGIMKFKGRDGATIPDDWKVITVPDQASSGSKTADIEAWDDR